MRQDWTIAEHWIRDMMKFYFCAQQFLELSFPFLNFKKSFFDSFQIFQIRSHMEGEGKSKGFNYGDLNVSQDSS